VGLACVRPSDSLPGACRRSCLARVALPFYPGPDVVVGPIVIDHGRPGSLAQIASANLIAKKASRHTVSPAAWAVEINGLEADAKTVFAFEATFEFFLRDIASGAVHELFDSSGGILRDAVMRSLGRFVGMENALGMRFADRGNQRENTDRETHKQTVKRHANLLRQILQYQNYNLRKRNMICQNQKGRFFHFRA
jgi:hypothetical protein